MRITICTWLLGIGLDQLTPFYFRKIYVQKKVELPKPEMFNHDAKKKDVSVFSKQSLNYNKRARNRF